MYLGMKKEGLNGSKGKTLIQLPQRANSYFTNEADLKGIFRFNDIH